MASSCSSLRMTSEQGEGVDACCWPGSLSAGGFVGRLGFSTCGLLRIRTRSGEGSTKPPSDWMNGKGPWLRTSRHPEGATAAAAMAGRRARCGGRPSRRGVARCAVLRPLLRPLRPARQTMQHRPVRRRSAAQWRQVPLK